MKNREEEILKEKLIRIEKQILKFPEFSYFCGGISRKNIEKVQKETGILFPVSYQWFLMTFGMGSFGDFEMFGLAETETGELNSVNSFPDLRVAVKQLRKEYGLSGNYLPVCGDGLDGYFCIRTDMKTEKDAEVYFLNVGKTPAELSALSVTFADFLSEKIQNVTEEKQYCGYISSENS